MISVILNISIGLAFFYFLFKLLSIVAPQLVEPINLRLEKNHNDKKLNDLIKKSKLEFNPIEKTAVEDDISNINSGREPGLLRNLLPSSDLNSEVVNPIVSNTLDRNTKHEMILSSIGISYVYYLTHKSNLQVNIFEGIMTKTEFEKTNNQFNNIESRQRFQTKYYIKDPIYGKDFNNYVEIFFNPRNSINTIRKDAQKKLVLIALDRALLYKAKLIFSYGDCTSNKSIISKNFEILKHFDWNCIVNKTTNNDKNCDFAKNSSALVKNKISSDYIKKVYCFDNETFEEIKKLPNNNKFSIYNVKPLF